MLKADAFSKRNGYTFTTTGYNWKSSGKDSLSVTHREAEMKWKLLQQPSINNKIKFVFAESTS